MHRAYGTVYKAVHHGSNHVVAIKQVAVDDDLQSLLKEIAVMQQLSHHHIVQYYGSYFYNEALWVRLHILSLCVRANNTRR